MVRSEQDVEKLVRENQNLVQYAVNRYLQRYFVGVMEREDLVSWGQEQSDARGGLVYAARAWDPARAGSFSTLACKAIERMILRGVRREWKPDRAVNTVSLEELLFAEVTDESDERFIDRIAGEQNVEQEILDRDARAAIRSAVGALPPAQRRLIERHFFEGTSVARMAEEMGLCRQTVYLRRRLILKKLRATLAAASAAAVQ